MLIYLDPQTDVDYTAFYIKGLYDLAGRENVFFSGRYFDNLAPNRTLKFVLLENQVLYKYVIDWGDDPSIDGADYNWCDYYGKINFHLEKTLNIYHPKIICMAPGFGIKLWNNYASAYYGLMNLIRTRKPVVSTRKFLSKYYKQRLQLPLDSYKPMAIEGHYIYSLNTLWNSNEWINNDDTVNQYRANFMNACLSMPNIQFEGGFVYSDIKNENPAFKHLVIDEEWIPKQTYINKVQASVLVFNTPAWALCHGWKLGEYLALGKAIISTPISNELPAALEHGRHIHIVSGEEREIKDAIDFIINNPDYRQSLEKNAYAYYCQYGSPIQSIKSLIAPALVRIDAGSTVSQ